MVGGSSFLTTKKVHRLTIERKSFVVRNDDAPNNYKGREYNIERKNSIDVNTLSGIGRKRSTACFSPPFG